MAHDGLQQNSSVWSASVDDIPATRLLVVPRSCWFPEHVLIQRGDYGKQSGRFIKSNETTSLTFCHVSAQGRLLSQHAIKIKTYSSVSR